LLSFVLLAPPLGVVIGYSMTSAIILNKGLWETPYKFYWFQPFRLLCYISWIGAALIVFIPGRYLNIDEVIE